MSTEPIKIPRFLLGNDGFKGFIKTLAETVGINLYSKWKYIPSSTYTVDDSDHKCILVFSAATPTVTLPDTVRNNIELVVIQDGSGVLTFSGVDKSVNATIETQYAWTTVVRDSQGNWRVAGGG